MANGLTPLVIRQYVNGQWIVYAPVSAAEQVVMPQGIPLSDYLAAQEPDGALVTLPHDMDCYPAVQVLAMWYHAGVGGAGIGPAGGKDPEQCPYHVVYPSRDSLTIFVPSYMAGSDDARTLIVTGVQEYLLMPDTGDCCFYIRILPQGNPGDAVPAQLYIKPVKK